MHNLHFFRNIVWNMSRIFPCLLEFFMSRICPVLFVQNLSRIFYVWNLSSFICPEFVQNFFMSRICLEKISGIFHVQNLSSLFVQNLSRFFVCPEYVRKIFLGLFSCPEFVQFFGHEKIPDIKFDHFSGHFSDIFQTWKINFGQFRWHFPDISFHRVGKNLSSTIVEFFL